MRRLFLPALLLPALLATFETAEAQIELHARRLSVLRDCGYRQYMRRDRGTSLVSCICIL